MLKSEGMLYLLLFENYNEFFEARKNMTLNEVKEFLKLDSRTSSRRC